MSKLSRIRGRLVGVRLSLLKLRPECKSPSHLTGLNSVVRRIEAVIDYADERFANERSQTPPIWRSAPEEIERERLDFEAWAASKGADLTRVDDGGYAADFVRFAWGGWIARHLTPYDTEDPAPAGSRD